MKQNKKLLLCALLFVGSAHFVAASEGDGVASEGGGSSPKNPVRHVSFSDGERASGQTGVPLQVRTQSTLNVLERTNTDGTLPLLIRAAESAPNLLQTGGDTAQLGLAAGGERALHISRLQTPEESLRENDFATQQEEQGEEQDEERDEETEDEEETGDDVLVHKPVQQHNQVVDRLIAAQQNEQKATTATTTHPASAQEGSSKSLKNMAEDARRKLKEAEHAQKEKAAQQQIALTKSIQESGNETRNSLNAGDVTTGSRPAQSSSTSRRPGTPIPSARVTGILRQNSEVPTHHKNLSYDPNDPTLCLQNSSTSDLDPNANSLGAPEDDGYNVVPLKKSRTWNKKFIFGGVAATVVVAGSLFAYLKYYGKGSLSKTKQDTQTQAEKTNAPRLMPQRS